MIEARENTGIAMQIGLGGIAEYAYLLEPSWKESNAGTIKDIPNSLKDYDNWTYIGVESDICSILKMIAEHPGIPFINAHVGKALGMRKIATAPHVGVEKEKKGLLYHGLVVSLSQLIGILGLSRLDVLAVDIEGGEVEVFLSYDWRIKPFFIAVEFHKCFPHITGDISEKEFVEIFSKQGYSLVYSEQTNVVSSTEYTWEMQFLL